MNRDELTLNRIMSKLDESHGPTAAERDRIMGRMLEVLDDAPRHRPQGQAGTAEIIRLVADERSWRTDGHRLRYLGYVAALVVVAGFAALLFRANDPSPGLVVTTDGGATHAVVSVDGGSVRLDVPTFSVVESGEGWLLVAMDSIEAAVPPLSVLVAHPTSLFDGMSVDEWAQDVGVRVRPVSARFEGEPIEAYSLTVDGATVSELGCAVPKECVQFGELADDSGRLSLVTGRVNSVHLIPTGPGEQPIVLFSSSSTSIGPGFDGVAAFQSDILEFVPDR